MLPSVLQLTKSNVLLPLPSRLDLVRSLSIDYLSKPLLISESLSLCIPRAFEKNETSLFRWTPYTFTVSIILSTKHAVLPHFI